MYIIAEIGVNHDGDLNKALKLIDAAVDCGCNAVKFQSFYAERLVHSSALKVDYQLRSNSAKESHFEMIKRLEFNGQKFLQAFNYSKKRKIDFITTPYDPLSAFESYKLGVRNFKTASADLSDLYLHNYLSNLDDIDLYIATGMSAQNQIKNTLDLYNNKNPYLLHCVSGYPCQDNSLNLNCFSLLKEKFPNNKLGFSDHSEGLTAAVIAASLGYEIFERHFTINKNDNGPDHYASSNVSEMREYVKQIKRVKKIMGSNLKTLQNEEIGMSLRSKKAILAKTNIVPGDFISFENTYALRPAEKGISIDDLKIILGKKVIKNIEKGNFIQFSDLQL